MTSGTARSTAYGTFELVEEPQSQASPCTACDALAMARATIARLERELSEAKFEQARLHNTAFEVTKERDEAREMATNNGEGWRKEAMRWSGIGGERAAIERRLHQLIEDIEDGKVK